MFWRRWYPLKRPTIPPAVASTAPCHCPGHAQPQRQQTRSPAFLALAVLASTLGLESEPIAPPGAEETRIAAVGVHPAGQESSLDNEHVRSTRHGKDTAGLGNECPDLPSLWTCRDMSALWFPPQCGQPWVPRSVTSLFRRFQEANRHRAHNPRRNSKQENCDAPVRPKRLTLISTSLGRFPPRHAAPLSDHSPRTRNHGGLPGRGPFADLGGALTTGKARCVPSPRPW